MIGLAEGANSAAFEFVGWNDDNLGDLADWVTSVVRGNVSPPLRFSAHCLVGPGEKPVVLVAIDASDRAPHAVDVGSKLQYPVRDGRSKRYLSEAEVADWYGRRLQRAGQRELDLDRLTEEGAGVAEPEVPTVLMGLAPMRPGLGRVLPGDLERYQEEPQTRSSCLAGWALVLEPGCATPLNPSDVRLANLAQEHRSSTN